MKMASMGFEPGQCKDTEGVLNREQTVSLRVTCHNNMGCERRQTTTLAMTHQPELQALHLRL